ncbi:MAG TPA: hypothetical protein IAB40_06435 [Candidatus Onthocola stercoravium]|nr:hypothetical protein [Candidatus Onthocola stercoravium]
MTTVMNNISKIFPSEKGRQNFIVMSMLTFGMLPETMANLLGMPVDEFNRKYVWNSEVNDSVYRRSQNVANTQEEAVAKFKNFFRRLCLAYINKDKDLVKKTIQEITDAEANEVIKTRKSGKPLTDQECLTILKYQIKYALSILTISHVFSVGRSHYSQRVEELLEQYPEYRSAYETLCDSYSNIWKNYNNSGRK